MRIRSVQPGDLVLINKKGRIFHARVQGLGPGGLAIAPLERRITYRQASAREVVDHWRHAARDRGEATNDAQIAFDLDP